MKLITLISGLSAMVKIIVLGLTIWTLSFAQTSDILLPDIGDSAGALLSPQEEYRIGQSFYWHMQQSMDLIDDPEINGYLQSVGYRIVAASDSPSLQFTFFMVPAASVNAFAAPGGFIGVHSGLLLAAQTEDELASVLAHEVTHVTQRHLLRSFERSRQLIAPTAAAMIMGALLGSPATIMAAQAGNMQTQINFTRSNEAEADNLGMLALVRAGFDPTAMPAFFERLQKIDRFYASGAAPEFLRTHPITTSRIADARGRATNYSKKTLSNNSLQFYLMREKLRVMLATNLSQLKLYYSDKLATGNSLNETATRYGYSLALMASGDYAEARNILSSLIEQDSDCLSYQLALADIEIAVGQLETALAIYQDNQTLYPDDQVLTLKQVSLLLLTNLPQQATSLLLGQLELGNVSGNLYKLLAQAKNDMGEKSQSHSWLAEYYYHSGRLDQALDQLYLAAQFVEGDEYQLAKITARLRAMESMLMAMRAEDG